MSNFAKNGNKINSAGDGVSGGSAVVPYKISCTFVIGAWFLIFSSLIPILYLAILKICYKMIFMFFCAYKEPRIFLSLSVKIKDTFLRDSLFVFTCARVLAISKVPTVSMLEAMTGTPL